MSIGLLMYFCTTPGFFGIFASFVSSRIPRPQLADVGLKIQTLFTSPTHFLRAASKAEIRK